MTTATKTNEARAYALEIASELISLETLHEFITSDDGYPADEDHLDEVLAEWPDTKRKQILEALDAVGGLDEIDEYNGVAMAYLEQIIEISYTLKGVIGKTRRPFLHSAIMLRSTGGPKCVIETFDAQSFEVRAYEGSDTFIINRVQSPTLASALWDYCEAATK